MQVDQAGRSETFCAPNRQIYNSEVFDMINFGFLYVTPLLVMTVSKLDEKHKQLINTSPAAAVDVFSMHVFTRSFGLLSRGYRCSTAGSP